MDAHNDVATPKASFAALKRRHKDVRTSAQIQEHYSLEVDLADRLRWSQQEERLGLYGKVYDELFARLPHHPQLTRDVEDEAYAEKQVRILRRLVKPGARYVEIGAGDAKVALALTGICSEVVAIDVSNKVLSTAALPRNYRFVLTNGIRLDLPDQSADFVYSNQLMEHLHPADAVDQLKEIFRILAPAGCYFCITPNRIRGPHDVSRYYDDEARGLHLKEYTTAEITELFRAVGFTSVESVVARGGIYAGRIPARLVALVENALDLCPGPLRRALADSKPMRAVLGVSVLARK